MKSKLFSISATAILILLAIVAMGQVAPVLAGITPTPTPVGITPTATPTITPTATPIPPTATPVSPPTEITPTPPVETPLTATPAPFLPDAGGMGNGLAQVGSIFVVMAGALLLLLAVISHVMVRAK